MSRTLRPWLAALAVVSSLSCGARTSRIAGEAASSFTLPDGHTYSGRFSVTWGRGWSGRVGWARGRLEVDARPRLVCDFKVDRLRFSLEQGPRSVARQATFEAPCRGLPGCSVVVVAEERQVLFTRYGSPEVGGTPTGQAQDIWLPPERSVWISLRRGSRVLGNGYAHDR